MTAPARQRPSLVVPDRLNRNSARVTALMPPEQAGLRLLERMRQQIGIESYADLRVLDFGCGVRFSQTIVNAGFELGHYAGVDNCRDVIDFLSAHARDLRLSYHFLDAHHPLYHPTGQALSETARLDVDDASFDVACMFSVITHQSPADSRSIFALLRRYVRPDGHLFFTAFVDDAVETFEDRSPERNCGVCVYRPAFLRRLVVDCGWRFVSSAPSEGALVQPSFVFRPA